MLIAEVAATGAHVVVDPRLLPRRRRHPRPVRPAARLDARPPTSRRPTADVVAELASARARRPSSCPARSTSGRRRAAPTSRSPRAAPFEKAKEHRVGDATRGAFSVALVESLDVARDPTTYRSLLATVPARVERPPRSSGRSCSRSTSAGSGDALFLDGAVVAGRRRRSRSTADADGWEVDGGIVHGFRDPVGDEAFVLACRDDDGRRVAGKRAGDARRRRPFASSSRSAWTPADVAYRAVIVDVPLPPAEVQLDPPVGGGAGAGRRSTPSHDAVRARCRHGRTRRRAVAVRRCASSTRRRRRPAPLRLRVGVPGAGTARIAPGRRQRRSSADTAVADGAGARLVVSRLEHIARWEQVRALGDHPSPLAGAVSLDVFEAARGETARPADRQPLPTDGGCVLAYRRAADGDVAGAAGVHRAAQPRRTRTSAWPCSTSPTASAATPSCRRCSSAAGRIVRRSPTATRSRRAARRTCPSSRARRSRDWLKVIVSDVDFDASSFTMQQLDQPAPPRRARRRRSAPRSSAWRQGRSPATSAAARRTSPRPSGRRRRSSSRSASRR